MPVRRICLATAFIGLLSLLPAAASDQTTGSGTAGSAPTQQAAKHPGSAPDSLFDQLKVATDPASAKAVETLIWRAWMQTGDDEIDRMMQQSVVAMQLLQLDLALAILDAVVQRAPDYAEGWNKRATVLYYLNQFDRSMDDIGKVLAIEPRHFGAISGIGLIKAAKGDKQGAIEAFKRVLEIYPASEAAKGSIDAISKQLGDPT